MLTSHRIEVTWKTSLSSDVTGYLITYTTTKPFTSHGNLTVTGSSTTSGTLTGLEEGTLYTIAVQATNRDNERSVNSDEVSVRTYTDGK